MELKPGLSALVTGGASGIGNFLLSCFFVSFDAFLVLQLVICFSINSPLNGDDFTVNDFFIYLVSLLIVLSMDCLNHVAE